MSTLVVQTLNEVPRTFIRGQTLEFIMDLPADIPDDYWNGPTTNPVGTATTNLQCELRQLETEGQDGFIARLDVVFEPGSNDKQLRFRYPAIGAQENTNQWPLGPVEFDVVFTRIITPAVSQRIEKTYRSQAVQFIIRDGVTQ